MNLVASLNFGFRVSDETITRRVGRYKTPVAGTALLKGTAVEIDFAVTATNPGRLKQSAAATTPLPGQHGLLWQEEEHIFDIYERDWRDSRDLTSAKKDKLALIVYGAGTKVWMKNVAAFTERDGTAYPAVNMFVAAGVTAGGLLTWNGTAWANTASADPWMKVTAYDVAAGYLEATLLA